MRRFIKEKKKRTQTLKEKSEKIFFNVKQGGLRKTETNLGILYIMKS